MQHKTQSKKHNIKIESGNHKLHIEQQKNKRKMRKILTTTTQNMTSHNEREKQIYFVGNIQK